MGQRVFSKLQYGLETNNGTAVAADTILAFTAQALQPDRTIHFPVENLGVRMQSSRAEQYSRLARYDLVSSEGAYFEALPILFSMLTIGGVSPVEQTGGAADYLWDFTPDLTFGADNTLDSITLEIGDDTQAYEIEYGMLETLSISGAITQDEGINPVELSGSLFGRQVTATSFTGSLNLPTMTQMNSKLARLYSDATWANRGNTEVTNILRGFTIDIVGGAHPKFMGSANPYFNTHGQAHIALMATLTLERGAASDAFFDDWQAGTRRYMSLQINGPQIGAGDLNNLTINWAAEFSQVVPLASQDRGNNIDTIVTSAVYDATGEAGIEIFTTANVASV